MPCLLLRILDRLEEILIASLMGAATVLIFVAVVHRYASGVPFLYPLMHQIHLSWAQELCIYMFVWMAKFGAAYGVRTGIHVGVDVLVNKLDERLRKQGDPVRPFLRRAVHRHRRPAWARSSSIGLMGTEQTSPDLELPSWLVYLAIPLGSSLMCFRFLQVAYAFWRTGELPHHDHSHVEGVVESPQAARELAAGRRRDERRHHLRPPRRAAC